MNDKDDDLILILAIRRYYQLKLLHEDAVRPHSRYRKDFLRRLTAYKRRIRRRYIPRPSLHLPSMSAWRVLYLARQDQALITLAGIDFATLDYLAPKFKAFYDRYTPWTDLVEGKIMPVRESKGRPRLLHSMDCMALALAWTRTRGSTMILSMVFGMTSTPLSLYIRFGRRILSAVLNRETDAAIRVPTDEAIQQMMDAFGPRHPDLGNVWCTVDGLKLTIQKAPVKSVENRFFNSWTHGHYVGNVFVFCPDGTIPICCMNVPGSVHDSKIAEWGNIYDKLEAVYQRVGGRCVADSAFCALTNPYIIKSGNILPADMEGELNHAEHARRINAQATSARQSAEWGMRALQASFPCLKDKFYYEEGGERKRMLKFLVLLYNFRARRVGINQIRSVYFPYLELNPANVFN